MWKKWKIDENVKSNIDTAVTAFFHQSAGSAIDVDVQNAFLAKVNFIVQRYIHYDFYLIGKWKYDEQSESFDQHPLINIAQNKMLKYFPYLKVFSNEFIAITGEETHEREYENEHNRTENSTAEIGKTKESSTEFDGNGTDRKAEEESPIGSASIDSAPTSSTVWNLASPSKKAGQQYDTHNESSGEESSTENRTNAVAGNETGEGTDSLTIRNPDKLLKILRFNVENLNLTKIAYMFVDSLVEEKNTIY